jgi:DNA-binding transcriptional MerR regulator
MHLALILPGLLPYHPLMAEEGVSIGSVSRLLGVPVPTIRSWERRYGFPTPPRTDGSHRRYGPDEIEQLRAVREFVTAGHSTRDAIDHARRRALGSDAEGGSHAAVIQAAMAFDPAGIRAALDAAAERAGVEDAIREVALPAMRAIGATWAVGRCDVEQEHLATEGVRAWLARQAFLAPAPFRARPIVLACGPDDLHTIGLEAFAVILSRRGWPTRVLGARTPVGAVVRAIRSSDAVAGVVTAQRAVTRRSAAASVAAVHSLRGVRAFYAGSAFAAPAARRDVAGIYLGDDVLEAVNLIERRVPTRPR